MSRSPSPRRREAVPRVEVLEDRLTPSLGDLLLTLPNPAAAPADRFGFSVAMDDRYIVVGAPFDDPGGVSDAGSAYVFERETGRLALTIPNPEPQAGDRFGHSVVIADGWGYIGAPFDNPGGVTDSGTVYSFALPGSGGVGGLRLDNPSPAAGDQFGYALARDVRADWLAIGAPGDDFGAADAGRAYVAGFRAGALWSAGFASNPAPAAGDRFGESVAVTLFGTLLVGAPADDVGGIVDAGRAFVYDHDVRAVVGTFENPAPAAGDRFGTSVAVSGNTMIALIGAPGDDPDGVVNAGSAFAFDINLFGGTFAALIATLTNPQPAAGDNFGASVAASDLVALVGAPNDDPGGVAKVGSAFLFRAPSGELLATLVNPDPTAGDRFGTVALSEDRGVVLAPFDDPGGVTDAGSAYVYDTNNPPRVTDDRAVVPRDAAPTAVVTIGTDSALPDLREFLTVVEVSQGANGGAVAIAPDGRAVTYAPPTGFVGTDSFTYTVSDGRGGRATGTVTVLVSNPPGSGLVATLGTPPEAGPYSSFGTAVAASETWVLVRRNDGEPIGVHDAATGALVGTLPNPRITGFFAPTSLAVSGNRALVGAEGIGEGYLYDLPSGTLLRTFRPPAPVTLFGISVALDGDTVVIGSYEDQEAFGGPTPSRPGRVFAYSAATGSLIRTVVNPTFDFLSEGFGSAVAVSGNTLVVGAPFGHVAANIAVGQAYVYDLATGSLLHTLNSAARHFNQLFGISVAVSGGRVAVGAREQVYLFDATTGALLTSIGDPTPTITDLFGVTVGLAGDRVLVGAMEDDPDGRTDAGMAYLFDAATGTYLRRFDNPIPAAGDRFGVSVALAGRRAVVGAWQVNPAAGAGAAYLFDLAVPPTPRDDTFVLDEDSPASVFDVLANDFTVPGDGELSVTGISQPAHGTVTLQGGVVRYTPEPDYHGPDSFTYTVSDGRGGTATATVNVTVTSVNDGPTLADATFVLPENSSRGTTVGTLTATDVDGDQLTYRITGGNSGGAFAIDEQTGRIFVANPAALDYEQTPTFALTVEVRDPGGLVGTATVTIRLTDVPESRRVVIDIKPGDTANVIDLGRDALIQVAILSTGDFNALSVNPLSLRFGRTGRENALFRVLPFLPLIQIRDVNGDGRRDMVVIFVTRSTGLRPGDLRGILTGRLRDGTPFWGDDLVTVRNRLI